MRIYLRTLILFAFFSTQIIFQNCFAETDIKINDRADSDTYTLNITGIDTAKIEVFEVDNPYRLVIDIPNTKQKLVKGIFKETSFVKKIRIGRHPDKTRVVIDLPDEKPTYSKSTTKDSIAIKFTGSLEVVNAISTAPKVAATPHEVTPVTTQLPVTTTETKTDSLHLPPSHTPTSKAPVSNTATSTVKTQSSPTPLNTSIPTQIPTAIPTLLPTAIPSTTHSVLYSSTPETSASLNTQDEAPEQKITGIHFKKDSEGPLTEIALVERSEFSLSKVKNRRFKLTIPKCVAGSKGLLLPHFPPNDIAGFTLIQVTPGVDSIDVFVGVDDGMKVTAASIGNSIVLRPVPAGF